MGDQRRRRTAVRRQPVSPAALTPARTRTSSTVLMSPSSALHEQARAMSPKRWKPADPRWSMTCGAGDVQLERRVGPGRRRTARQRWTIPALNRWWWNLWPGKIVGHPCSISRGSDAGLNPLPNQNGIETRAAAVANDAQDEFPGTICIHSAYLHSVETPGLCQQCLRHGPRPVSVDNGPTC